MWVEERRRAPRIALDCAVMLHTSASSLRGRTVNISDSGLLVVPQTGSGQPTDAPPRSIRLELLGGRGGSLRLRAVVARECVVGGQMAWGLAIASGRTVRLQRFINHQLGKLKSRRAPHAIRRARRNTTKPPFEPQDFGRYTLTERLAFGGMAEVFRAELRGTHGFSKSVVIKRILPHLAEDERFVEMFINEAQLMSCLHHSKVVQVLDFGAFEQRHFMVLEYIDGVDLADLLKQSTRAQQALPPGLAVHLVVEVLDALDYVHNLVDSEDTPLGIVHRDVSPPNIFISRQGDVKLGDFGIARASVRQSSTNPGTLKGKYGYMSPEQVCGRPIDARCDVFSASVVLAELLTQRRLFKADNTFELLSHVRNVDLARFHRFSSHIPDELRAIIERGLARDPARRFQSAAELSAELTRYAQQQLWTITGRDVSSFIDRVFGDDGSDLASSLTPIESELEDHPLLCEDEPSTSGSRGRSAEDLLLAHEISQRGVVASCPRASASSIAQRPARLEAQQPARLETQQHESQQQMPTPELERRTPKADILEEICSGDLSRRSPFSLLFTLATTSATGVLTMRSGAVAKRVHLQCGRLQHVDSNRPDERFGRYLIERGALTSGELSLALAMVPTWRSKLGQAIVRLRLLPFELVRESLANQQRIKLLDLLCWETGRFTFDKSDPELDSSSVPLDLDVFSVLATAVVELSPVRILRWAESRIHWRLWAASAPPVQPDVFGSHTRRVFDQLDGRPLAALLRRFDDPAQCEAYARLIFLLVETGMARAGPLPS